MSKFYRVKPDVVQAVQYNGKNEAEVFELIGEGNGFYNHSNGLWIFLKDKQKRVDVHDYVVRTSSGDLKLFEPKDFNIEYESVL